MAAHTAALLVTWKIIAVDGRLGPLDALAQSRDDLARQKIGDEDEGPLIPIVALPAPAPFRWVAQQPRLLAAARAGRRLWPLHHTPIFEHHPNQIERCNSRRRDQQ